MENVKYGIYFDRRRRNCNAEFAICFKLYREKRNVYFQCGMFARLDEFDGLHFVGRGSSVREKETALYELYDRYCDWCDSFYDDGMSNAEVKAACEREVFKRGGVGGMTLGEVLQEYIRENLTNEGTRTLYGDTLRKVMLYGDVKLRGVTCDWLKAFDRWLEHGDKAKKVRALKVNTRARYLRDIRAAMNYAVTRRYTTNYPFREFKIREEETPMRVLTLEEIRTLRDYPCQAEWQAKARDMWMLSFYLLGINNGDLFKCRGLEGGRFVYRRTKTKKIVEVAVPPEAMEIIERYKGRKFLLDVCDKNKNYKSYVKHLNEDLKTIGMEIRNGVAHSGTPLFPKLSMYYARYSAATLMADLDVPMETISRSLGHSSGKRVTQIYVKFNMKKVDRAQRKMIDALDDPSILDEIE